MVKLHDGAETLGAAVPVVDEHPVEAPVLALAAPPASVKNPVAIRTTTAAIDPIFRMSLLSWPARAR
jgi:hypothetical protein